MTKAKPATAYLYFNERGYAVVTDDKALSLLVSKSVLQYPEEKTRMSWFYLGRGLKDVLQDKYEFVKVFSNTKIIDQLRGAEIDDDSDCIAMRNAIITKGIPQFAWVDYCKLSDSAIKEKFAAVRAELAGDKDVSKTE